MPPFKKWKERATEVVATTATTIKEVQKEVKKEVTKKEVKKESGGKKGVSILPPPKDKLGLLITVELEKALADCKAKVARISKTCRASNKKFRDLEFDIENDTYRCLYGLEVDEDSAPPPPDTRRVTEIYDNPKFFVDGISAGDIVQGALGDCWFLSALATLSSAQGLIEKCCVARDEQVGVYGFIFFRHNAWESVVIDDQLFWSLPKYEELKGEEQKLWHNDKDLYNEIARKRGKGLYFARCGTEGETWVPLIEKAYAKLHGDFGALDGGLHNEAIEDLTGGVSLFIKAGDILDTERFWREELVHAGNDRLFGLSLPSIDTSNHGHFVTVKGLIPGHAYSVIRAQECRGKKFVIIRNPWGSSEWTGAWSDGAKEWNGESMSMLTELGHVLGDDGQFVMEYSDFLATWDLIERTTIFNSSWIMSSHWISAPTPPDLHPWTFGDIFFDFSLPEASESIIVLSQMGNRYFRAISGLSTWQVDFVLYKRGEEDYLATSSYGIPGGRSVMCELELDAGDYVVFVRVDRFQQKDKGYFEEGREKWQNRKLSRVLSQRVKSRSIASNFDFDLHGKHLPLSIEDAIAKELDKVNINEEDDGFEDEDEDEGENEDEGEGEGEGDGGGKDNEEVGEAGPGDVMTLPAEALLQMMAQQEEDIDEDEDSLFLGLRVYTKNHCPVSITGRLWDDED